MQNDQGVVSQSVDKLLTVIPAPPPFPVEISTPVLYHYTELIEVPINKFPAASSGEFNPEEIKGESCR